MQSKQKLGRLFLIPTPISENTNDKAIPLLNREVIKGIKYYLAENLRTSRRFISSLKLGLTIEELQFEQMDKRVKLDVMERLLQPLSKGHDMGIMSEAGCPGIADPGALAVSIAHSKNIEVVPLVGPSSIFMALMSSGFNGQSFSFIGYLPIDKPDRLKAIKSLAQRADKGHTQIFMDTPYRNQHLFNDLIATLPHSLKLCIAKDVTGEKEMIKSASPAWWKKNIPELHKVPVIFIVGR